MVVIGAGLLTVIRVESNVITPMTSLVKSDKVGSWMGDEQPEQLRI